MRWYSDKEWEYIDIFLRLDAYSYLKRYAQWGLENRKRLGISMHRRFKQSKRRKLLAIDIELF